MTIALDIIALLAGLAALLWYFYRLGEKAEGARKIQQKIDAIEGNLHAELADIPDAFYRGLNPNYVPTLKEKLESIEFEHTEQPNYSIEPN